MKFNLLLIPILLLSISCSNKKENNYRCEFLDQNGRIQRIFHSQDIDFKNPDFILFDKKDKKTIISGCTICVEK